MAVPTRSKLVKTGRVYAKQAIDSSRAPAGSQESVSYVHKVNIKGSQALNLTVSTVVVTQRGRTTVPNASARTGLHFRVMESARTLAWVPFIKCLLHVAGCSVVHGQKTISATAAAKLKTASRRTETATAGAPKTTNLATTPNTAFRCSQKLPQLLPGFLSSFYSLLELWLLLLPF